MAKRVAIRPLDISDKELVYRWRNSETQVAFSRTGKRVSRLEHSVWIRSIIMSPNEIAQIIEHDGFPIGLVRVNDGFISIYIVVSHGKGVGSRALWMAMCKFYRKFPENKAFIANVVKENNRSLRFFERNGFILDKLVDGLWECKYELRAIDRLLFKVNRPLWAYRARRWLEWWRKVATN